MRPPCWSTILRTMESPRPVPASLVVKKGSKDLRHNLGVDPGTGVSDLDRRDAAIRRPGPRAPGLRHGVERVDQKVDDDLT